MPTFTQLYTEQLGIGIKRERLKRYATAKGYKIKHIVKEVGGGANDNRTKLLKL